MKKTAIVILDKIFIFYSSGQCQVRGSARSEAVLLTKSCFELDNGDCVVLPGLPHLGHLLPLSGEGVELQDVLRAAIAA